MFRYREHFHLSYQQLLDEPIEEIERAMIIWSMDSKRDKLESERQAQNRRKS